MSSRDSERGEERLDSIWQVRNNKGLAFNFLSSLIFSRAELWLECKCILGQGDHQQKGHLPFPGYRLLIGGVGTTEPLFVSL